MKIVVTGSLGNISKPLTTTLVQKEHQVTVISSNPEKQKDIKALGATAAIGTLADVNFLSSVFTGADAVYCMVPPNYHFDAGIDPIAHYRSLGGKYAQAIKHTGVKRVVHLSSIGAHLEKNTGLIIAHYHLENILKELPGVFVTHLRPTAFYYNLYAFVHVIKSEGRIASNYGEEDRVPWVSPLDIAEVAAEELTTPGEGRTIRYIASDEPTCNQIAAALGAAIGKPDLKWELIADGVMQKRMEAAGMSKYVAAALTEMNASMHSGELLEDYYRNRPATLGKVKITDFAKEFAVAVK